MPPNVDMSLIREAMARRAQGGGVPAAQQVVQPTTNMPSGAPASPVQSTPQPVNAGAVSQGSPQQPQAKQPQQKPQYDDSTKVFTKALIQKLMQVL
ncbi:hypothetical protein [Caudoviricetes sp.]|nr:hypothetical protein [Caudoviricetes sp.]